MLVLGPFGIVSIVLGAAGAWKVFRPRASQAALRTLRVPATPLAVRGIGLVEIVVGAVAFLAGGRLAAALVAAAYVAFAGVAWRLRGGTVGCGCFGAASSTPPGGLHVAVDLAAAAVATGAAGAGVPGFVQAAGDLPLHGVAHVLLLAVGSMATLALLTVLPDARAAARTEGTGRAPQPVLFTARRAR